MPELGQSMRQRLCQLFDVQASACEDGSTSTQLEGWAPLIQSMQIDHTVDMSQLACERRLAENTHHLMLKAQAPGHSFAANKSIPASQRAASSGVPPPPPPEGFQWDAQEEKLGLFAVHQQPCMCEFCLGDPASKVKVRLSAAPTASGFGFQQHQP
jgi:hypothetical protein